MKWSKELSVGIEHIDEQHRELFLRIANLVQAIKEHRCRNEIDGTLEFLKEYTIKHFGMEEELMDKLKYPDSRHHKAQHTLFLKNVEELKGSLLELQALKIQGGSYDLSAMTNQVVVDWIIDHIMKVDTKFGEFLKTGKD